MRSDTDLRAAGQRAASQPVPTPPPLAHLERRANKLRTKRRVVGSSLAALALAAVSIPVALNVGSSSTTVQDVVAGTGQIAPASQTEGSAPPARAAAQDDNDSGDTSEHDVRVEVRAGDDFSLTIQVRSGEEATTAAAAAEAAADETLDVEDGLTVWVARNGDETTVSSLVEPDEFVQVTGNADQVDKLIEVLRNGGGEWQGFTGFGHHFGEDFDWGHGELEFDLDFDGSNGPPANLDELLEGLEGLEGLEDLEDLADLEDLEVDVEALEQFLASRDFQRFDIDRLEQFLEDLGTHRGDRSMDGFEQFGLDQFFENAMPQIEQFFENGDFGQGFDAFGENFDGCIAVHDDTGLRFEFPKDCSDS